MKILIHPNIMVPFWATEKVDKEGAVITWCKKEEMHGRVVKDGQILCEGCREGKAFNKIWLLDDRTYFVCNKCVEYFRYHHKKLKTEKHSYKEEKHEC